MTSPLICVKDLTMHFDGHTVLDGLNFDAKRGEIHGLIGENAAGKSTFGHVLAGEVRPHSGSIYLDGKKVSIRDRSVSEELGIRMCFHKVEIYSHLTVFENIVLGREQSLGKRRFFLGNKAAIAERVQDLMHELHLTMDPFSRAHKLSEGEKLLIQLARTVIGDPKLIILDEATAILTEYETKAVFDLLHRLRDEGKCILLISHNIKNILDHSDRISIMEHGTIEGTYTKDEAKYLPLVNILTGHTRKFQYPRLPTTIGDAVMHVEDMQAGILKNISFDLHRGEIMGVAGLVGSGRTTLMNAISGTIKLDQGKITFPQASAEKKPQSFGIVPDNYDITALFNRLNIAENITVSNMEKVLSELLISRGKEEFYARDMVDRLGIDTKSIKNDLNTLSAGNKQKVVIARSIFSSSDIYLFDEPTQNLSAVSKLEIYNIFNALVHHGAAIVLISSDFSELLGMCNRILMLRDGQQVAEALQDDLNVDTLYEHTTTI